MVTVTGTVVAVGGALAFFPRGAFFVGTLVVTLFVLTDTLDGAMARKRGISGPWGAFLDSTLRPHRRRARSSARWCSGSPDGRQTTCCVAVALFCLVSGAVTSYAKARAEGLGHDLRRRARRATERLIVVLLGTLLAGSGFAGGLAVALWVLAVASAVTVGQRLLEVRRQTRGGPSVTG